VEVKAFFGNLREGAEAEYPGVVNQNVQSSGKGRNPIRQKLKLFDCE
jgi:hypothetical protein